MSEQTQNQTTSATSNAEDQVSNDQTNAAEERAALMARADLMGIDYHPNIGLDKLRERVNAKLSGDAEPAKAEAAKAPVQAQDEEVISVRPKTRDEKLQDVRTAVYNDAMALVRCKITNLNPRKRELKGELITVANKFIGKVTKFIPFGEESDEGYHIPKVIYDDLVGREYQDIRTVEKNGKIQVIRRMAREYSVEILPPLTEEELQELALKQAAAERLGV